VTAILHEYFETHLEHNVVLNGRNNLSKNTVYKDEVNIKLSLWTLWRHIGE